MTVSVSQGLVFYPFNALGAKVGMSSDTKRGPRCQGFACRQYMPKPNSSAGMTFKLSEDTDTVCSPFRTTPVQGFHFCSCLRLSLLEDGSDMNLMLRHH